MGSWHTRFDHVFQICCIVTFLISYVATETVKLKFSSLLHNCIENLLKVTGIKKYSMQEQRYSHFMIRCSRANLVGF